MEHSASMVGKVNIGLEPGINNFVTREDQNYRRVLRQIKYLLIESASTPATLAKAPSIGMSFAMIALPEAQLLHASIDLKNFFCHGSGICGARWLSRRLGKTPSVVIFLNPSRRLGKTPARW